MTVARRHLFWRVLHHLIHPGTLPALFRYRLRDGNEYLYFDFADVFPSFAGVAARCSRQRLDLARPLFLATLRRSGSTLFYRIMHSQKNLFLFNERFPGDRLRGRGLPSDANIWSVAEEGEFRETVLRYIGPHIRRRYRRWGVKLSMDLAHPLPGSMTQEGLRMLFKVFSAARVVGLVRDPRDFVLSALSRAGKDARWWIDEYRAMMELFEEVSGSYPERFLWVRYQQMLNEPEATIRKCCAFAGLEFDERMLWPSSWSVKGPKAYASDRIVPQAEKWRKAEGADLQVVRAVEDACFPAAERFGYSRSS